MLFMDMNKAKQRSGYTEGLDIPKMDKTFYQIYDYLQTKNFNIVRSFDKSISLKSMQKETKAFFSYCFSLYDVCILPKKYDNIFYNYLKREFKNPQEFNELLNKYASFSSPFFIPITTKNINEYNSGIISFHVDELDESTIPIINSEILMSNSITEETSSYYANQITSTQTDRVKGSIQSFHHREVLSILIEKIISFEKSPKLFYELERKRLKELKDEVNFLFNDFQNNVIWSFFISTVIAEELFNHYILLTEHDKVTFFKNIQSIFDGNITLEEFIDKTDCQYDENSFILAVSNNLRIN